MCSFRMECDVERTAARTGVPALWFPPMVPTFVSTPQNAPVHRVGVFHGVPYGPREQWIHHPALKSCLTFARPGARNVVSTIVRPAAAVSHSTVGHTGGNAAAELTHYDDVAGSARRGIPGVDDSIAAMGGDCQSTESGEIFWWSGV